MEEMKCTYDVFAFSPRALLLRRIFSLLAHPLVFTVPAATLAAAFLAPNPSQSVAAAFLQGFSLVLIRFSRKRVLHRLDALARKDAKALRLRNPQRYAFIRRNLFPEPLSCSSAPCTCSAAYFRSL